MQSLLEQLPRAARAFSTSAAASQAAPALAGAAKRSFIAQLFSSGSRLDVPLTDALPGVQIPEAVPAPKDAPTTQLTKLSNGFTVATEATPVSEGPRAAPASRDARGKADGPMGPRVRRLPCRAGCHRHPRHLRRLRLGLRDARQHRCAQLGGPRLLPGRGRGGEGRGEACIHRRSGSVDDEKQQRSSRRRSHAKRCSPREQHSHCCMPIAMHHAAL